MNVEPGDLQKLLMDMNPLSILSNVNEQDWNALANELKATFPPDAVDAEGDIVSLAVVYYRFKKNRKVMYLRSGHEPLIDHTVNFLETFMRANGQWEYLDKQEWYQNGDYVIGIDVNYYPRRAKEALLPGFHKDTGGNNVFVNLIFDNKQPIEATEWFVDVAEPGGVRAEWQQKLLPPSHLKELAKLRATLQATKADTEPMVRGGVRKENNIFVSWVDDLVWHATPAVGTRYNYAKDAVDPAVAYAAFIDENSEYYANFQYFDAKLNAALGGVELLATIAEHPDTHLAAWLKDKGLRVQDVNFETALDAWTALYADHAQGEPNAKFVQDVETRKKLEWRITGYTSEAIAHDKRLIAEGSGSKAIARGVKEMPVGLAQLRRENSLKPEELKKVAAENKGALRCFIRTWVRILPKNISELATIEFDQ